MARRWFEEKQQAGADSAMIRPICVSVLFKVNGLEYVGGVSRVDFASVQPCPLGGAI